MRHVITLIVLTFSIGVAGASQIVEAIVARVGDRIITRSDYLVRLDRTLQEIEQNLPADRVEQEKKKAREELLDNMINELLIKDRADRLGLRITQAQVDEAIERLKSQYGIETEEQFLASLTQSGLTRQQMEDRLRDTLISNQLFARELRSRSQLEDRELRKRYEREKEQYRLPERARVREIVLLRPEDGSAGEAGQLAEEIAGRARAGEDFLELVATYSQAPSKQDQGDLGIVSRGELLGPLDDGIFKADASSPLGSIVGPVMTRFGYHVLRVEERLPSEIPPFEVVKDRLRQEESDETFQRDLQAYLDSLRANAFVRVNPEVIPQG